MEVRFDQPLVIRCTVILVVCSGLGCVDFGVNRKLTFCQERLQPTQWEEDLEDLVDLIEEIHPDPFHSISKTSFLQKVNAAKRLGSATICEKAMGLATLVALLGETHSYLHWPDPHSHAKFRRYPFRVAKFSDGVFVTQASSKYKSLIGQKLVKIGNTDVEHVLSAIKPMDGADNQWTHDFLGPRRISRVELMTGLGFTELNDAVALTTIDSKNKVNQTVVLPGPADVVLEDSREAELMAKSLYWRDPDAPYWSSWLPDSKLFYLQVNQMRDSSKETMLAFARRFGEQIAAQNPKRIIVDLRRNTGGNSRLARPLARELIRANCTSSDGGLIVLIGPSTISAAVVFAEEISHFTKTVFVGSATGSNRNQWGDNVSSRLPNSQFRVSISTKFYQTGGPYAGDQPIYPTLYIPESSVNFFRLNDVVLNRAIHYKQPASLAEVFNSTARPDSGSLERLEKYVFHPERKFQDFERPLRKLAESIGEAGNHNLAVEVCNLLIARYPERSRPIMVKAHWAEQTGNRIQALKMWSEAKTLLPNDTSLYPDLRRRMDAICSDNVQRLSKK